MWNNSHPEENALDQEKVQNAAIRLILGEEQKIYEDGLLRAKLESLKTKTKKYATPLQSNIWRVKIQEYMIYSLKRKLYMECTKIWSKICKNKQTQKLIFTLCEKNPQLRKSTISKIRFKMKEKKEGESWKGKQL